MNKFPMKLIYIQIGNQYITTLLNKFITLILETSLTLGTGNINKTGFIILFSPISFQTQYSLNEELKSDANLLSLVEIVCTLSLRTYENISV